MTQLGKLAGEGMAVEVFWSEYFFDRVIDGWKVMDRLHDAPVGAVVGLPVP